MGARDRVSIEEGEKASERLEEGPVGEKTDALVAVNAAGPVRSQINAGKAELRTLALRQFLLRIRLIELDGCSVYLPGKKASQPKGDHEQTYRLLLSRRQRHKATVKDSSQIKC